MNEGKSTPDDSRADNPVKQIIGSFLREHIYAIKKNVNGDKKPPLQGALNLRWD